MLLLIFSLAFFISHAQATNKPAAANVSAILSELAINDVNGGGEDEVVVKYQNIATYQSFYRDNVLLPFFTYLSSRILSGPTMRAYETIQAMYKNPDVLQADTNSKGRSDAANKFLDTVIATTVMDKAWKFLVKFGLSPKDYAAFKKQIFDLWFGTYARVTVEGSSGFENVFVGETHNGNVLGLNYWYKFYLLEQAGKVNYHGWYKGQKGIQLEVQFSLNKKKPLKTSFLLGTSPEFEIAAYSICALVNIGECIYKKNGQDVILTVKTISYGGAVRIESVYPTSSGSSSSLTPDTIDSTRSQRPPKTIQELVDAMWAADIDKPLDFQLDWGNPRNGYLDVTKTPLYTYVNEKKLFDKPQYKALLELCEANLFTRDVCQPEPRMTGTRKEYVKNVFDAFTNTTMFQLSFKYLQYRGKAKDWVSFESLLWTLWMSTYSRCHGILGSSGFEHVFFGEWKGSKVCGQHCWVEYYRLEKAGKINYHGYSSYSGQLIGSIQYSWESYLKPIGGFSTGTSPAFDFAIFTVCALTRTGSNACKFKLAGYPIAVTTYVQPCDDGMCLATAYASD